MPDVPDVLVVDDEEGIRKLLVSLLSSHGYTVGEAADGDEAIRMMDRKAADLVVTDMAMPGREGIDIIRTIKNEHPKTKIIAISGADVRSVALPAAESFGADRSFGKPFDIDALADAVAELLGSSG